MVNHFVEAFEAQTGKELPHVMREFSDAGILAIATRDDHDLKRLIKDVGTRLLFVQFVEENKGKVGRRDGSVSLKGEVQSITAPGRLPQIFFLYAVETKGADLILGTSISEAVQTRLLSDPNVTFGDLTKLDGFFNKGETGSFGLSETPLSLPVDGTSKLHLWAYNYRGDKDSLVALLGIFGHNGIAGLLPKLASILNGPNATDLDKRMGDIITKVAAIVPPPYGDLAEKGVELATAITAALKIIIDKTRQARYVFYQPFSPSKEVVPLTIKGARSSCVDEMKLAIQFLLK